MYRGKVCTVYWEQGLLQTELYGKVANIDADFSKEALKNTGVLKKMTGGDYIPAEKKFCPPFQFVNHAKLLFSANEIPMAEDETDAFFSRLIIINFPNQFLGNKADPIIIRKLTTDDELSGLLRITLRRLPRVLKEGISTTSSSIDENYEKYILSSYPVRAFFEAVLEHDKDKHLQNRKSMHRIKCSVMPRNLLLNRSSLSVEN